MQILTWEDRKNPSKPRALIQQGRCDEGECNQFSISISNGERGMTVRFDSEAEFRANCGSARLDIISGGRSIQIRCYACTKTADVSGVILGEVDFLAGAQAKVEAMIAKAKERASKAASRRDSA